MSNFRQATPEKEITSLKSHQALSMSNHHLDLSGQIIQKNCGLENITCSEPDDDGDDSQIQILTKAVSNPPVPPVFTVSDARSSSHVDPNIDCSQNISTGHQEFGGSSVRLTNCAQDSSQPLNPTQSPKPIEKNQSVDPSNKTPSLLFQIPSLPQPQQMTSKLCPTASPKPRTRSQTCVESTGKNTVLMLSPASPSRKYFKVVSSPVLSAEKRRGSEPVFDGMSRDGFQCMQMNVTDRRWEKLHSILVAMRNEPFDVEQSLNSSSPELLTNLQEKINVQKEQFALQSKLSYLQDALKQKEFELQLAEAERDSALAYIRHLKANLTDRDQSVQLYEQGIETLRAASVSKENVIDMLSPLVKELHEQKSYLDCLMTVVLMRAPWMLDEVDKMELPNCQSFSTHSDDGEVDDFKFEDSDCEVWC